MKQNVSFCQFCDAFRDYGRDDNFSYSGKRALFDFLEQYGEDCGTGDSLLYIVNEVELDVIAITLGCEFTEYKDLEEFQGDYDADEYKTIEDIKNNTTVIRIDKSDGFIIQDF